MNPLLIASLIPVGLFALFGFVLYWKTRNDNDLDNYPRKRK